MSKTMEKPEVTVIEWPVSLYKEKKRKWVYGNLAVKANEITFSPQQTTDKDTAEDDLTVSFDDFIDIKKTTTGLVFGAIYVMKRNNTKLWFSSFTDREGVYCTLRHFWKSQLTGDQKGSGKISGKHQTQMGQKLLGIVHESEDTLSKAAVQLHQQGAQFDNAMATMHDLHNDLDIAEHLVEDLERWVGRWRMPAQYESIDPIFINKSEIPEIYEYEVLYTKLETGKANTKNLGTLRISKEGMTILTLKMKTEHHFKWSDVSQLRVVTPFELMVIRLQIGKPDLTYSLVSANMVAVLKLLDKCARYKLKYDRAPDTVLCMGRKQARSSTDRSSLLSSGQTRSASQSSRHTDLPSAPTHIQIQTNQSKQVVSEREADEISRALVGLKSLALSIQEEESAQNEKLDSLTNTVDRANDRLVFADKKIKKMM